MSLLRRFATNACDRPEAGSGLVKATAPAESDLVSESTRIMPMPRRSLFPDTSGIHAPVVKGILAPIDDPFCHSEANGGGLADRQRQFSAHFQFSGNNDGPVRPVDFSRRFHDGPTLEHGTREGQLIRRDVRPDSLGESPPRPGSL
jgi:hypothetical protein